MMWILVSSPSMIRSPGRRVMMSTAFLLGTEGRRDGRAVEGRRSQALRRNRLGRPRLGHGDFGLGDLDLRLLVRRDLLEQRGPDRRAGGLVDHLVTTAA